MKLKTSRVKTKLILSDSVSVCSTEPDESEDLERLVNQIFGESEGEGHKFCGFYQVQTVHV